MASQPSLQEFERRAAAGDADAMVRLALTHLHGVGVPRDADAAHRWLIAATAKGSATAVQLRANLIAAGIGVDADPHAARQLLASIAARNGGAAAQLDLLARVPEPAEPRRHHVNADPDVILVERLLAPEECRFLIAISQPRMRPSAVGTGGLRHPIRTSDGCRYGPAQEDVVLNRINRRIAAATGTTYEQGEPLHILRYTPGQEYRLHMDTIPGAANQRQWTALIYLNDGYQGGETDFPGLDIRVEGAAGDALLFRSIDAHGRADPRARHAGMPVRSGTKWLATRWIRQAPHDPWENSPDGAAA